MVSSAIVLSVFLATVSGITINTPTNWKGNQTNTVTWTSSPGDPATFDIELLSPQFHDTFAVANTVQTSLGTLSFALPAIRDPGSGFTMDFHAISNISDVFATSGSFTIQQQDASAVTQSTTTTPQSTGGGSSSGTGTGATTTPIPTGTPLSTTPVGSTISNTNTGTTTSSGNGTSSSSTAGATNTPFSAALDRTQLHPFFVAAMGIASLTLF